MREALVPASVRGPAGAGREQQGGGGGRKRCAKSSEGERVSEREPRGASRLRWAGWVGGRPPAASGPPQQCARFWWPRPPSAAERAAPVSWVPRSRGLVPASRSRSPLARPSLPPRRREPFPARRRRSVGRPAVEGGSAPAGRCRGGGGAARAAVGLSRVCVGERERKKGQRARERASPARAPPKAAQRPPLLPRSVGGRPAGPPGSGARGGRPSPPRGAVPASGGAPGRGYLVDPASSICLSQRLSHACVSAHGRYSETANGSLNQLWFLWSLPSRSLDNCGNSRANTCRRAPTSGDACIYQTKTNPGSPGGFGDSR